jgi:hypothetical protein
MILIMIRHFRKSFVCLAESGPTHPEKPVPNYHGWIQAEKAAHDLDDYLALHQLCNHSRPRPKNAETRRTLHLSTMAR